MITHFTYISTRSTEGWSRTLLRGSPGEPTTGEIPLLNNVCVWFLGMPLSAKCTYRLVLMSTKGNGKKKQMHFPYFGIRIKATGGENNDAAFSFFFFFFLWMERNRLRGTLMVLRNPIHMAPCTRETSDNQNAACQEDNNSSPFNLITATGTYNSSQAGVHWAAGATTTTTAKKWSRLPTWHSDARGKITPTWSEWETTSVGIRERSLGSGGVKQN